MRFEVDPRRARPLPFVVAWIALIVLAGVSVGTAFLGLGKWAPIVQFAIAAIQAGIVYIVFMRLKGPPSLKWVFAVTRFLWLLFLYGIAMTDYSNRRGWPPSRLPSASVVQTPAGERAEAPGERR